MGVHSFSRAPIDADRLDMAGKEYLFHVKITENTLLEEGLVVGDTVRVRGKILEDGTWEASRIVRALQADSTFELTGKVEDKDP